MRFFVVLALLFGAQGRAEDFVLVQIPTDKEEGIILQRSVEAGRVNYFGQYIFQKKLLHTMPLAKGIYTELRNSLDKSIPKVRGAVSCSDLVNVQSGNFGKDDMMTAVVANTYCLHDAGSRERFSHWYRLAKSQILNP